MGAALAAPFTADGVSVVVGVESFVAVRKTAGLLAGPKLIRTAAADYRGNTPTLRIQSERIRTGDRVLLVDDWAETGNQLLAVAELITEAGATVVGTALLVNQLDTDRAVLGRVRHLIHASQLGDPA